MKGRCARQRSWSRDISDPKAKTTTRSAFPEEASEARLLVVLSPGGNITTVLPRGWPEHVSTADKSAGCPLWAGSKEQKKKNKPQTAESLRRNSNVTPQSVGGNLREMMMIFAKIFIRFNKSLMQALARKQTSLGGFPVGFLCPVTEWWKPDFILMVGTI